MVFNEVLAPSAYPLFYRTYSRDKKESWQDVCDRTIDHLRELGKFTDEEYHLVKSKQEQLHTLTSGRWLWVGGTDWVHNPKNFYGAYNCLVGDTLVSTLEYGAVEISFLENKTVHVINRNGQWSKATFKRYPDDEIYEITLRRGIASGVLKTIRATKNHRWFPLSAKGEAVSTTELKPKDELRFLTAKRPDDTTESYILGVQHGIVFGDGSVRGSKPSDSDKYKVRLCGEKKELLPFFEGRRRILYCPSYKGDPLVMVNKDDFVDYVENGNLKQVPTTTDLSYLLGFLRGLIATDGSISERKGSLTAVISGTLETGLWIETILPTLGMENGSLRCAYEAGEISNYGTRNKALYGLYLYVPSLSTNDFLRTKHRTVYEQNIAKAQKPIWRVLDVQKIDIIEPVFCCEEPETHGFSLTGGIETGNCSSTNVVDWEAFGLMMNLAMQGCGTGAVLEEKYISQLPKIVTKINVEVVGQPGDSNLRKGLRYQLTHVDVNSDENQTIIDIVIGDSREAWVKSYEMMLEISSTEFLHSEVTVRIDASNVRPKGEKLTGFGGVANPSKLTDMYGKLANVLNKANGRKLTAKECVLLIDNAALVVVAGNIRRSAGIKQAEKENLEFATAKDNLWKQDENGNWKIDPELDALRMSNHTRIFHNKPTLEEITEATRKQFYSGEGALQWAGEAVARANADILDNSEDKNEFLSLYDSNIEDAKRFLCIMYRRKFNIWMDENELNHRMGRYGLNPCGLR